MTKRYLSNIEDKHETLSKAANAFAGGIIILLTVLTLVNVLVRRVGISAIWIPETLTISTMWLVFLLLGKATMEDEHIRIIYFYQKLPDTIRRIDRLIAIVLSLATAVALTVSAYHGALRFSGATTQGAQLPYSVIYLAPLIGMFLVSVAYVVVMVPDLIGEDDG